MNQTRKLLKQIGLKVTQPRILILESLQKPEFQHTTAEDLYKMLIDNGEEIGLATVYRVLNQFADAQIVKKHNFEGGKMFFELSDSMHHDHLICLDCGGVFEFSDTTIHQRQKDISKKYNMKLSSHNLYLYGHCENKKSCENNCKKDKNKKPLAKN